MQYSALKIIIWISVLCLKSITGLEDSLKKYKNILYVKLLAVKNKDMRIDDQNDMMVANSNMP